jgi:hypothetical protein
MVESFLETCHKLSQNPLFSVSWCLDFPFPTLNPRKSFPPPSKEFRIFFSSRFCIIVPLLWHYLCHPSWETVHHMSLGFEKDPVARCCIVVALRAFPSLTLCHPLFGRPFATWELGFEKYPEKQQQAQERKLSWWSRSGVPLPWHCVSP